MPAKRRGANIKPTVETLASECYDKGLLPDALSELVDLIIHPSHLDQASLNNLVRNLYPATSIDAHLIIKIVGCLGHGVLKPSLGIQAALLKWLIMTHHAIKDQDTLSKVYAVLFNLLDTAAIRCVSRPSLLNADTLLTVPQAPVVSSSGIGNAASTCATLSNSGSVSLRRENRDLS